MRLREYFDFNQRANQSGKHALREDVNEFDLDFDVDSNWYADYTPDDFLDTYRAGETEDGYPVDFYGDLAWKYGYDWMDSYGKNIGIKDALLTSDFYNFLKKSENLDEDSEMTVDSFVSELVAQYLWGTKMSGNKTEGYKFSDTNEDVYFYCVIEDEMGNPDRGAIYIDMMDDPQLVLLTEDEFCSQISNRLKETLGRDSATVDQLVQAVLDTFGAE